MKTTIDSLVPELIEILSSGPGIGVGEAGRRMLEVLTGGELSADEFLEDPRALVRHGPGVPRYVAQVIWRAVTGDYGTVEEVISHLSGVIDRNPPTLESAAPNRSAGHIVVPEARVLRTFTSGVSDGVVPEASFEAHVTSGPFRDSEITVRVSRTVSPTAWGAVSMFWTHASVALYNLVQESDSHFVGCADSFFILEPLRQVNATTVARSLACPRPEIDRLRQGRGEPTIPMLRGLLVHAILDDLIAGENTVAHAYESRIAPFLSQIAALTDENFDESAFRSEVLGHAEQLRALLEAHPHMRSDPQVEVRRYSPTIGIQGRIDAVFRSGDELDIVELKTGKRLRGEDHAQLYIYKLLLSDFVRRVRREESRDIGLKTRLICSHDGSIMPARPSAGFLDVMAARNFLLALMWGLGRDQAHLKMPYADYDRQVCGTCPSWTRSDCRKHSELFGDSPGVEESADLTYFRRLTKLVRQESWRQGDELAALLDDSRIAERVREFRTIDRARCVDFAGDVFEFVFDENAAELTVGDRVLIHRGEIASRNFYHGYIRTLEPSRLGIAVPLQNLEPDTFGHDEWIIDRLSTDLTSDASQTALYDFLLAPLDARKRVVLGDFDAGRDASATPEDPARSSLAEGLNASQIRAIDRAVGCEVFHLVWGPPGTGKTRIVPHIVEGVGGSVLLGAFTNTAVDNMLMAVLDRDPEARFLRIGRSEASPELRARLGERASACFSEDLARLAGSATELRATFDAIPLVAATAHRAASHPYLRRRQFGVVIVDEASQLTEPLSLGLVMRAPRFVLMGDDRQLPPVVRTPGLDVSLFERLKSQLQAGAPDALSLLDVQYRMHPAIMEAPNRLFYGGRLSAGVHEAERQPPWGRPLAFVPVRAISGSRSNPEEVEAVTAIVRQLSGVVPGDRIGVISPFRAQVALLRKALAGTGITVDTVERYQGGERDVILISFVRSRGTGFVFDDRRLNVAITRARRKLILVGHPDLFRGTKFEWVSEHEEAMFSDPGS